MAAARDAESVDRPARVGQASEGQVGGAAAQVLAQRHHRTLPLLIASGGGGTLDAGHVRQRQVRNVDPYSGGRELVVLGGEGTLLNTASTCKK